MNSETKLEIIKEAYEALKSARKTPCICSDLKCACIPGFRVIAAEKRLGRLIESV